MHGTTTPLTRQRQNALIAIGPPLLFLLLSAIFLWQPITSGKVFLPTDLSYKYDYMWESYKPGPAVQIAQNPTLSDVADYYYPYAGYAIKGFSSGHFPLWNPYILTGTPFFASGQAAVLDPINLLTYLAGPLDYWVWAAWLRLALLGFTTYGFMRALGRNMAGSIAAGVVFMTCGFAAVWLNYSVVTVLAWLPGLFWSTTRLMQTRQPVWLGLTAFTIGALLVGGHPETQFLCGLLWAAYCLYYLAAMRETKSPGTTRTGIVRRAIAPVGAALLGLAVGAAQWVPMVDFMFSSNAFGSRSVPVRDFNLAETALRFFTILVPNFTGTPIERNYWVPITLANFNEQTGYIGLLAVGLAVAGAAAMWRRERLVPFFSLAAVVALLFAVRAPGFHLIKALPLFSAGHGVRWLVAVGFFGAVLAGYGVEAISGYAPKSRRLRNIGLLLAGGALAVFGMLLLLYIGVRDSNWDRAWGPPALSHPAMARLLYPVQLALHWPAIFLVLGALVVLARWRGRLGARAMLVALIALLYADLWTFGSRYNPVTPADAIYPPTQATTFLTGNLKHARMAATISLLRPDVPMLFGFRDLRGYEDLVDAPFAELYNNFYNQSRTPVFDVSRKQDLELNRIEQRQLNIAGVRFIVTVRKPRVEGDAKPYRFIIAYGRAATYENLEAFPRAYVVYSSRIRPNWQKAVSSLRSLKNDPRQTVILESGTPVRPGPPFDITSAPVTWLADEPERVALEAALPAPGWLVLSDNYAPGWEAELDGVQAPILRANAVFRAVAVPKGKHKVTFNYRPRLVYVSFTVSAIALLITLSMGIVQLWAGRRRRLGAGGLVRN